MYDWVIIGYSLLRLGLAYCAIFVALPPVLFGRVAPAGLDAYWVNLVRMVCLTQVVVYVLAATRLYEVISLSMVYVLVGLWRFRRWRTREQIAEMRARLVALALDVADGLVHPVRAARSAASALSVRFRGSWSGGAAAARAADFVLLVAILGYSAYLRFYDALTNAAPAMSDSYVTLAWMKYVENRQLFHDGIYPQGFHIILSVLRKFSATEGLLALKYTGPLNSCLTTLSCYHFTSRVTGNAIAGLASAFAYGCLPSLMPYEFDRQAATNSQEFAMLFLLPAVWAVSRYVGSGSGADLRTVFAAASAIGLTHAMVAVFAACGALAGVAGGLLSGVMTWAKAVRLVAAGAGAAALSALPLVAGLLLGIPLHGSSAEFAAARGALAAPQFPAARAAVLAAGATAAVMKALFARTRSERAGLLASGLFVAVSVAIYLAPLFGVSSLALATRAGELLAIAMAVSAGLAVSLVAPGSAASGRSALVRAWSLGARAGMLLLMGAALHFFPQAPASPYKMQSNESAEQYIRILRTNRPTEWMIVSDFEGYSIVLGRGWHLMTGDFVAGVDPAAPRLLLVEEGRTTVIDVPKVYLFYEKTPYKPPIDAALPEYERKVKDMQGLAAWVSRYVSSHGGIKVYYDGRDLTVYLIEQEIDEEEEFRRIWGSPPLGGGPGAAVPADRGGLGG